jgi:hypothetical protein
MDATYAPAARTRAVNSSGPEQVAFLLLFPGFFFYQTLIGMGVMRAFLGGYFAIVSIVLAGPLAYAYLRAVKAARYRIAPTDVQFGFFLAYFLVIVLINAAFGADTIIVQTHVLSILYFINIYLVFKNIDFSNRKTAMLMLVSLLIMSATIFVFSTDGSFQPGQLGDPTNPESVATYQGFARSYVLTFVAVICFVRLFVARLALYCMAVAALFLNGSRSELVVVLFLLPLIELYRAKNWLHVLCILVLGVALFSINPQTLMDNAPDSRVWELFDLSHSDSANARHDLTRHALSTIANHPLLGDYASYPAGGYSHNILSAWVDLGFFGFAYLLLMLALTTFRLFVRGWLGRTRSGQCLLAWNLICMSLFLLMTAKTFDDMLAGAAMGAYANYCNRTRQAQVPDKRKGNGP